MTRGRAAAVLAGVVSLLLLGVVLTDPPDRRKEGGRVSEPTGFGSIIPVPVETRPEPGVSWTLPEGVRIRAGSAAAAPVAELLAETLRPVTGHPLPVVTDGAAAPGGDIALLLTEPGAAEAAEVPGGTDAAGGPGADEAYELHIGADGATVRAATPAGLFRGVQTLRQLLPVDGPPTLPGGTVTDRPRYPYRGFSLDIARHFFTARETLRFIDHIAAYKFNHLHLHLTDDQGWRLAIEGLPELTAAGAATQVGGGPGGFWTEEDYRSVVEYAARRYITVVPEIDLPGHTNAALVAYPHLGCDEDEDGKPAGYEPYTGIEVGFSSLCVEKDDTYEFVDRVLGRVAALTPGPYLHIGGDEALTLSPERYTAFMARVQPIVASHGKRVLAWHQLADAEPAPGAVLQYWNSGRRDAESVARAARGGARIVLSPADHVYLDMKYSGDQTLGLTWAGTVDLEKAYGWEPAEHLPGVPPESVLGVEGALWTETVRDVTDAEQLLFPRLTAVAETAWSQPDRRDWKDFRARVDISRARWAAEGIAHFPG